MVTHQRLLELSPGFRARQVALEQATGARMRLSAAPALAAAAKPVVIPCVVHVLYNASAENVSDTQINTQINVLNQDFRAKNPDRKNVPAVWKGLIADANIEFALATKDPGGSKTSGIVRVKTDRTQFPADETMKSSADGGSDAWPTDEYLNIWVCKLGNGLLGYAQFPGGPAETDGVVILNTAFGTKGIASPPFNRGRTTTHEVGHWLNLRHIWADTEDCSGTDFVADTPNALTPNYGEPTFPHVSCSNGPNGDMFMNYMDYVDDKAMFMFTPGQVARMSACLENARKGFLG